MALSAVLLPVSSPCSRRCVAHHVSRARVQSESLVKSVCYPSREKLASPVHSLAFGALGRSLKSTTKEKHPSLRALCGLQEGSIREESINNKKGPKLQWLLVAACVVAAGLVKFIRLKGGGLTGVGLGEVQALQADAALTKGLPEGTVRFLVKLPVLGSLSLGQLTPGWVYFLLLMAAGFGLFVSEEALNVWVGASLGRLLTTGSWEAFWSSLNSNAPYITATILWVYWGVCISDMIPFYAGRLASKTGDELSKKLGVSKEKYEQVKGTVQHYGNLIGVVERFSVGVRNPTAFVAGVAGIMPSKFFAGVCFGGLLTLPIQLSIGFVLREHPMGALAGVATVVGAWTVLPYAAAGLLSFYYFLRRNMEKPSQ